MKVRVRIQGILIFLASVVSILLSKFLFPHWKKGARDEVLDALGIGMVLFGFLFRIAARGLKKEKSAGGKNLVIDGPYRLLRNPMYFGTLMIGMGIVAVLLSFWVLPIFLLIFLLIYIPQINKEEKGLYKRFGDNYKTYCQKTPKYLPSLSSFFKSDLRDYLFIKWLWIKKELPSLIMVICFLIAIETWEDIRLFGYQELIKELLELSLIVVSLVVIARLFYKKE